MPEPRADGPDVADRYQDLVGPWPAEWSLCSTKCCEGQQTEHRGSTWDWRKHWAWMHAQPGIRWRGLYHWIRGDSTMAAQADFAVRMMRTVDFGQPGDIWQVDWETNEGVRYLTAGDVEEYCDRIRQQMGEDRIVVYSSDWVPNFVGWRDRNPDTPLWYANYRWGRTDPTSGWQEIDKFDADVWQWTSSFRHPAVRSAVNDGGFDMNHLRRRDRLDRIAKLADTPTEKPPPPVVIPPIIEDPMPTIRTPVDNVRLLDAKLQLGENHKVTVPQLPDNCTAVEVVVTVVGRTAPAAGWLTAWSGLSTVPTTSIVNWSPQDPSPHSASKTIGVHADGFVVRPEAGTAGTVRVIIDLSVIETYEEPIPGPPGATGPKGATGPTGAQGPKGDPGESGLEAWRDLICTES